MNAKLHFTCLFIYLVVSQPAYGQINEFKITASDGAERDSFGSSVSIYGNYAIVGAFEDDFNGFLSGSAYVYKLIDTIWMEEAQLLPPDGAEFDRFGGAVSISGDYAIVGVWGDDDNGPSSGSAYVFKRNDTSWRQEAKLLPSDGHFDDAFGISVSISGDYAVIGSYGDDDNGDRSGSAYVFKRTGTNWVQDAKLLSSDGLPGDFSGSSVSISGDYVVVGLQRINANGAQSGPVYVFKRTGTNWVQEAKLLPADVTEGDLFGRSVSISGDYIVVGSLWDEDNGRRAGSAYLFKRTGTSWVQESKILASDGSAGDEFGYSVSISGDYAVVGARKDDANAGSAYLFKRIGTSWVEEAKILASDGTAGDEFGGAVSISGDYAVVGAWKDDDNGDRSGSAYLYNGLRSLDVLTVLIPQSFGIPGDTLWMPLNVSNTDSLGIISSEFRLMYDTSFSSILGLNFQQTLPDIAGWTIETTVEPGTLRVAMSGEIPLNGTGVLTNIQFALNEDDSAGSSTPLLLSPFLFNDGNLTTQVINGSITVGVPAMSLSTNSISFSTITIGHSITRLVIVTNVGQVELVITDYNWSLPEIDVEFSALTAILGASIIVSITFSPDTNQTYRDTLEIHSNAGLRYVSLEGLGVIGIKDEFSSVPSEWTLEQNHPNPFNPTTTIEFTLPQSGDVSLIVYNQLGEEINRLVDGRQSAGSHQVTWNASNFSSGIYFYRLQAGDFVQTRKMVLLK